MLKKRLSSWNALVRSGIARARSIEARLEALADVRAARCDEGPDLVAGDRRRLLDERQHGVVRGVQLAHGRPQRVEARPQRIASVPHLGERALGLVERARAAPRPASRCSGSRSRRPGARRCTRIDQVGDLVVLVRELRGELAVVVHEPCEVLAALRDRLGHASEVLVRGPELLEDVAEVGGAAA